jgi:hypothetical protein
VTLSEIADGLEVVERQRDRGVATVDDTGDDLAAGLREYESDLPCDAGAAATVVETFVGGAAVGTAAREAGVVPVTAAKTLHLLGVEGVSPLGPTGREVVRDWVAGELSHAEARELTGASERAFALAAFVETHDPLPGAGEVVESARSNRANAAVEKRERLAGALSDPDEFL